MPLLFACLGLAACGGGGGGGGGDDSGGLASFTAGEGVAGAPGELVELGMVSGDTEGVFARIGVGAAGWDIEEVPHPLHVQDGVASLPVPFLAQADGVWTGGLEVRVYQRFYGGAEVELGVTSIQVSDGAPGEGDALLAILESADPAYSAFVEVGLQESLVITESGLSSSPEAIAAVDGYVARLEESAPGPLCQELDAWCASLLLTSGNALHAEDGLRAPFVISTGYVAAVAIGAIIPFLPDIWRGIKRGADEAGDYLKLAVHGEIQKETFQAIIDRTCEEIPFTCSDRRSGCEGADFGEEVISDLNDLFEEGEEMDELPTENADADLDGFSIAEGDCDDTDPAFNPGVDEEEEECQTGDNLDCDETLGLPEGATATVKVYSPDLSAVCGRTIEFSAPWTAGSFSACGLEQGCEWQADGLLEWTSAGVECGDVSWSNNPGMHDFQVQRWSTDGESCGGFQQVWAYEIDGFVWRETWDIDVVY